MKMFFQRQKLIIEHVAVYIEVEDFKIGDYRIDVNEQCHQEVKIVGTIYEFSIWEKNSHNQKSEERIEILINVGENWSNGILGFLFLSHDGCEHTGSVLRFSNQAINNLVKELRELKPKKLTMLGSREKGSNKDFEVSTIIFSQHK
jgi:hypothetical protein